MKTLIKILIISTLICYSFDVSAQESIGDKQIIGQKATVKIKEGGITFKGRVDTGAKTTSINAENIKKVGDYVEYTIVNKHGKTFSTRSKIVSEKYIRNAEGQEKRYFVHLTLEYKGISRKILVNLNDRSNMTYKILLGRNWLEGHYIVDVSIK